MNVNLSIEGYTVMAEQRKRSLKHVRASLGLTQVRLAEAAGVSEPAIIDVEKNRVHPRMTTAYAILNALNDFLREKGKPELTLDSLNWTVQGYNEAEDTL